MTLENLKEQEAKIINHIQLRTQALAQIAQEKTKYEGALSNVRYLIAEFFTPKEKPKIDAAPKSKAKRKL